MDDFTGSSIDLAAPVTHETFPISRGFNGQSSLDNTGHLEWTCFHVPPGMLARRLFEYTYSPFIRSVPLSPRGLDTAPLTRFKHDIAFGASGHPDSMLGHDCRGVAAC